MHQITLLLIFVATAVVGCLIIETVHPLLHTALRSGIIALWGITVLGPLTAVGLTFLAATGGELLFGRRLSAVAAIAATVNIVGGFGVTHRLLKMFDKKKKDTKS